MKKNLKLNNKIFIFEFVSGGGFNNTIIPTSLFCEGFGMLRSITADFKLLDFEIYTTLDYRISFLSKFIKADHILNVKKNENSFTKSKIIYKKVPTKWVKITKKSN